MARVVGTPKRVLEHKKIEDRLKPEKFCSDKVSVAI